VAQELGFLKTCEENSFSECTECDIYVGATNKGVAAVTEVGTPLVTLYKCAHKSKAMLKMEQRN
jgi:hypothetical protein